jgi:DNA repair protein RadD
LTQSSEIVPTFTDRRFNMRLRKYQNEAVETIYSAFENRENFTLIQAATGSGKTVIFCHLIRKILSECSYARIAVIAHRRELIMQARDKMLKVDPDADIGIACSSLEKKKTVDKNITIGTIQTLANQSKCAPFNYIIIDEVHRLPTKDKKSQMGSFLISMLEKNPGLKVLGVTATPYRMNHGYIYGDLCKTPYANWFKKKNFSIGIDDLQEQKFLCDYLYMVAEGSIGKELESVSLNSFGEYKTEDLENKVIKHEHLQSAVKTLESQALDRRSIVIFCVSILHAEKMKEVFLDSGIYTESIHSEMPIEARDRILEDFNQGKIRILTNVNVLTEGWDAPRTDCIMLCRPTLSAALYVQMVGRGLRTFEGKKDCMVLDLANCFQTHGSVKFPVIKHYTDYEDKDSMAINERNCPHCKEIIPLASIECPYCNQELKPTVVYVEKEQKMSHIDDGDESMIECPVCQVPYRYDQLEEEWLSTDPDSSPMGLLYCPEEHPVKAMEPAKTCDSEGEYKLINIFSRFDLLEDGSQVTEVKCILMSYQKDPYYISLFFKDCEEDLDRAKEIFGKLVKNTEAFDFYRLPSLLNQIEFEPVNVCVQLTEQGCLLKF